MSDKVGILFVGCGGAVASTAAAGIELFRKGAAPRVGLLSETGVFEDARGGEALFREALGLVDLENLVVGGWDICARDLYAAAASKRAVARHLLALVEPELAAIVPMATPSAGRFDDFEHADNVIPTSSHRETVAILTRQIADFRKRTGVRSVVVVNVASTEPAIDEGLSCYDDEAAYEACLGTAAPQLLPSMLYFQAAIESGSGWVNFTPSVAEIPVLRRRAKERGIPFAGRDGKTGQTMLKTAIANAFNIRQLQVRGWFSTNILGNSDGKALEVPSRKQSKINTKSSVLSSILGYEPAPAGGENSHLVSIHYYAPRGDAKESWDNIDVSGFLDTYMQIKINFLCMDSILAAPLVIDLVRFVDIALRLGEGGEQEQLSLYFKYPVVGDGADQVHELNRQFELLCAYARRVAARPSQPKLTVNT